MNEVKDGQCRCNSCQGQNCACGCQKTKEQIGCACGPQCGRGDACTCAKTSTV